MPRWWSRLLVQRYFRDGYHFIPPYRSTFWCRLARWLMPHQLRRQMAVARWHFQGLDLLRESLRAGAGILLTPNHCRYSDPAVVGQLGAHLGSFFYFIASYHLFKQGRLLGWYLNRIGGFSINRDGADRESLRESIRILTNAERPLVVFPEGTWFRQNDRLGPLQEGVALIARQAARRTHRPVRVHPVGIKYWLLQDPRPVLGQRLQKLEAQLGWRPQRDLPLVVRFEKLGSALLGIKEVEFLGQVQPGSLDERIGRLAESRVAAAEKYYMGSTGGGWILERIRRLRRHLVGRLVGVGNDPAEIREVHEALEDLLFCENLSSNSMDYLYERPNAERLVETLQRLEETMTDQFEEAVAPLGVVVAVGPALDVEAGADKGAAGNEGHPLMQRLSHAIQGLLDGLIAQGPPRDWNCPAFSGPELLETVSTRGRTP